MSRLLMIGTRFTNLWRFAARSAQFFPLPSGAGWFGAQPACDRGAALLLLLLLLLPLPLPAALAPLSRLAPLQSTTSSSSRGTTTSRRRDSRFRRRRAPHHHQGPAATMASSSPTTTTTTTTIDASDSTSTALIMSPGGTTSTGGVRRTTMGKTPAQRLSRAGGPFNSSRAPPPRINLDAAEEVSVFATEVAAPPSTRSTNGGGGGPAAAAAATAGGDKPIPGARRLGSTWKRGQTARGVSPRPALDDVPPSASPSTDFTGSPKPPVNKNLLHLTAGIASSPRGGARDSPRGANANAQSASAAAFFLDSRDEDARLKRLEIQRVIAQLPRLGALVRSSDPNKMDEAVRDFETGLAKEFEASVVEMLDARRRGVFFYQWQAAARTSAMRKKRQAAAAAKKAENAAAGGNKETPVRVSTRVRSFIRFEKRPNSQLVSSSSMGSFGDLASAVGAETPTTTPAATATLVDDDDDDHAAANAPVPPKTPISSASSAARALRGENNNSKDDVDDDDADAVPLPSTSPLPSFADSLPPTDVPHATTTTTTAAAAGAPTDARPRSVVRGFLPRLFSGRRKS